MDMFPWDLRSGADMDVKASIRMEGRTRIASACQHYNRNKKYIAGISVSENIRKTNIRNTSHSDGFSKLFPARMTGGKFRFSIFPENSQSRNIDPITKVLHVSSFHES